MANVIDAGYGVIGAGSAGRLIAARLREDPGTENVPREAGRAGINQWVRIPLTWLFFAGCAARNRSAGSDCMRPCF
jgi:choline dehydrogenase-like flavoprotein